ncbi:hypothetical protein PVK06_013523 [Gossypium arboreum]|uniref:Isopenicillin N synthase-like Fe(2+) 2OG dioxygenase domain-containing protein n=1 Tax=Gossypium arboreum TaxID=29729 RepID=A0ABR0PRY7_GOSAR|nr:hypothetical protein PVK06_013523 [Gossypium arboreum]
MEEAMNGEVCASQYEKLVRIMAVSRQLFNLPLETKKQNIKSKPLQGYYEPGGDFLPFYESFGLEDASNCNSSKASPNLCRFIAIITSAPQSGEYTNVVSAHTDKLCSALLCEDGISGLEIETKDGDWVKLCMPPGTFAFIVGDLLNAWSNGRMHAANHRVMLSRNEYRYSLGTFAVPVEGTIIKAAKEMVDEEHPRVFKDFDFMDFVDYANAGGFIAIRLRSCSYMLLYPEIKLKIRKSFKH